MAMGFVTRHLYDLIDEIGTQNAGHKTRTDTLNLVRPGLAAGKHWTLRRLDRDGFERRLLRLDVFAHAGKRAARSNTGDENVDFAVGIVPDLRDP